MSSRVRWETDGFCVRCYFHGEVRPAQTVEPDQPADKRRYCRQCEEHVARKEAETRRRLENRPQPQTTHHNKEAT